MVLLGLQLEPGRQGLLIRPNDRCENFQSPRRSANLSDRQGFSPLRPPGWPGQQCHSR